MDPLYRKRDGLQTLIRTFIKKEPVLVIAALAADGQTVMDWIDYIERGYEDFDGKLRGIGADIVKEAVNDIKEA